MFFRIFLLGGTARVEVFGTGSLDISTSLAENVTVGSIEGDGLVFLGANQLAAGSNNLATLFSGVIQDGGVVGGEQGSLTKIGTGRLVLANANTYTGGTVLQKGNLVIANRSGSGTGKGDVQVNGGTLSGRGTISGAVTLGTGSGASAVLAPGRTEASSQTLTIQKKLTFKSDGTYHFELHSNTATADGVIASGVTIRSGAQFFLADIGGGAITAGTVFTAIDNTAATPIVGTFSNLPDDSTLTAGNNTFQVDYQGGNGNDLTLTVVP